MTNQLSNYLIAGLGGLAVVCLIGGWFLSDRKARRAVQRVQQDK